MKNTISELNDSDDDDDDDDDEEEFDENYLKKFDENLKLVRRLIKCDNQGCAKINCPN